MKGGTSTPPGRDEPIVAASPAFVAHIVAHSSGDTSADGAPGTTKRVEDAEAADGATTTPHLAPVRALEFYCGVGGLHFSLRRARPDGGARVVGAFDINPNACDVYEANFGVRPITNSLTAVPAARLDAFNSSLWLMSPPCQPFTRQGAQRDAADARSASFLRLLVDVLPALANKPSHLLVENVVGFETSETRGTMLATLERNGFEHREFILSPRMFGVPYSRPRYFCVAKTRGLRWVDGEDTVAENAVRRAPPRASLAHPKHWVPPGYEDDLEPADPTEATVPRLKREDGQTAAQAAAAAKARHRESDVSARRGERGSRAGTTSSRTYGVAPLRAFLESSSSDASWWSEHEVPLAELRKARLSVDAVLPGDRKCNCFTKSYGKFTKGTGSFVAETRFDFKAWDGEREGGPEPKRPRDASARHSVGDVDATDAEDTARAEASEETRLPRVRYFSPREVANIHSFPATFEFPDRITKAQRFALLGNSLSVACVAPLLEYLLNDTGEA